MTSKVNLSYMSMNIYSVKSLSPFVTLTLTILKSHLQSQCEKFCLHHFLVLKHAICYFFFRLKLHIFLPSDLVLKSKFSFNFSTSLGVHFWNIFISNLYFAAWLPIILDGRWRYRLFLGQTCIISKL